MARNYKKKGEFASLLEESTRTVMGQANSYIVKHSVHTVPNRLPKENLAEGGECNHIFCPIIPRNGCAGPYTLSVWR